MRHRIALIWLFAFLCVVVGPASAQALDYGSLTFAQGVWSNGQLAFNDALYSHESTETTSGTQYAAGSLRGFLFRFNSDGSYAYLGDGSGGRFLNQTASRGASMLGCIVPAGTYVVCFASNTTSYKNILNDSHPALKLKTASWYKSGGVANSINEATKIRVTKGRRTCINDVVLPDQTGAGTTKLTGTLRRTTKYREVVECRLLTSSKAPTGFTLLKYADSKGRFSFSSIPSGTYALKYAVASARKPSRLQPLSLFTYQAPSTTYTVSSGATKSMPAFTLSKMPRKRWYPKGAAHQFQRVVRSERWLSQKVRYSQVRWHEGYRTDCSGYTSMLWGLGRSTTTRYWRYYGHRRALADMKQGDVVILEHRNGRPYHAVMFIRWVDKRQRMFEYIHLTGTGVGKRVMNLTSSTTRFKAYSPKYHTKMARY